MLVEVLMLFELAPIHHEPKNEIGKQRISLEINT